MQSSFTLRAWCGTVNNPRSSSHGLVLPVSSSNTRVWKARFCRNERRHNGKLDSAGTKGDTNNGYYRQEDRNTSFADPGYQSLPGFRQLGARPQERTRPPHRPVGCPGTKGQLRTPPWGCHIGDHRGDCGPDPSVREDAILALRQMGPGAKVAIPALAESVRDRDRYVGIAAA